MKEVANQSSLIKQCLVHFPTSINWRLPVRASEVAKITTRGDGNLSKSKQNGNFIQTEKIPVVKRGHLKTFWGNI